MKIYLASSWRNPHQPEVLAALRAAGHQVYDFRHPSPDNSGFSWSEIDPDWERWSPELYRFNLQDSIAERGFNLDMVALDEADACVLLLPSGRSAHLEAGYAIGKGKPVFILMLGENEPELMYKMAAGICVSLMELVYVLDPEGESRPLTYAYTVPGGAQVCRVCGCWEQHACPGGCHWVAEDLYSRCGRTEVSD